MRLELLNLSEIEGYPSGSAMEFHDDTIYLAGDDARDLLVMNKQWKKRKLISLFQSEEQRISKKTKADLEAMSLIWVDEKPHLLILGSGSAPPRNQAILVNLKNHAVTFIDISPFYERLRNSGVPALNIEGAATVQQHLVLANRGNKSQPGNHLIITSTDFFNRQDTVPMQLIRVELPVTEAFSRLSGITYSEKHQCLVCNVSTEDTPNATDDGPIGKSYLGRIEHFSGKIDRAEDPVSIMELFDLAAADKAFRGFKIESVCIQSEQDHSMKLHLVADNDTGVSYMFKARLEF